MSLPGKPKPEQGKKAAGYSYTGRGLSTPGLVLHDPWDGACVKHLMNEPTRDGARCLICRPEAT